MYLDFYGLKEKPFSLTPDPQFLYLSESHRTAIDSLLYGIQQREGFMVVTGEIGTGKTTICRSLLDRLDKNVKTAVIFNSFLSEGELLRAILQDFGFKTIGRTKAERIDVLNQFLLQQLSQDGHVILLIDEAQNLSIPVLEQIRMLSNLETTKEKMLQIILFGQLELNQKLWSPKLKQLNQRVAIRHHIRPLSREETESYIYQRLTVAGSHGTITFSKSALNEIYRISGGTPRLINLICDRSLLGGFVDETNHIDKEIVLKAKKDLGGETATTSAFRFPPFLKQLTPLRLSLLIVLILLLAGMLLLNYDRSDSLRGARNLIHEQFEKVYLRVSNPPSSSITPISSGKKIERDSQQKDSSSESQRISPEGSK
jgi:general secretion pathway protein A